METVLSSKQKEVVISDTKPTVLIGERINPTGKKKLTAALQTGNLDLVVEEALAQANAGADLLDVNVGASGVDEVSLLPEAIKRIEEKVNLPLCIDSSNPKALEAGLRTYQGKALVNSVNGEERSLKTILPLVKEYKAAVIALPVNEAGIPTEVDKRLAISYHILEEAALLGIQPEDIIIDCLALTVGSNDQAGIIALETIKQIKAELGLNITVGASNISFGLPDRDIINHAFLAIAIKLGLTCPIVDVAKVRPVVLAIDLILGRDRYAMRYIRDYRKRQS